ncbi:MAG: DUF2087 domain-containing protein [Pseudomonadota bacterium]
MTREPISLTIVDVSEFSKSLRNHLHLTEAVPNHTGMLNLIARAAGFQNFQHLKATPRSTETPDTVTRALRVFDERHRMIRWPNRTALQGLCLWVIWHAVPKSVDLTEAEINAIITAHHTFGDHALLRRVMIEHRQLERTTDGRVYRRCETTPPPDAVLLFRSLRL